MKGSTLLSSDPTNLIITGVGGQGNVLASRMIGEMLSQTGLHVTIGETFGASQRGGSVMSHLRVSSQSSFSPQIPKGRAHIVVSLEPAEAVRVLKEYGNPEVRVICNSRPIHPIGVISGEQTYPSMEDLKKWIGSLSSEAWFIDATEAAIRLGNPILGNIVSVGALAGTKILPLDRAGLAAVLERKMSPDKVRVNLTAFDIGVTMIHSQQHL
ncbi:MAG: indolepyruvate ferredoxin oxidoreductase [Deltaproteobacteria bacterium HGW-Deltaproteobacteria-21]|jgi:indolepyruvate ferredoxin oxidoreductase beta subunit|nr:MAG: indolepyruvate ferredoxin oxidoreductase [Deltaproteobacteria bacterium HGW-Deltaproteobacteria-21]